MTHPNYQKTHADMSNEDWITKRNEVQKMISQFIFDRKYGRNPMQGETGLANEIMNTLVGTVPTPPPVNLQDAVAVKQAKDPDQERGFPITVHGEPLSPQEAQDLITDIKEHLEYNQKVRKA